jgi:hypothetical protein
MGQGGVVLAEERTLMTYALWRLLVICVAGAAGETIAYQLEVYDIVMWFGIFFGAAAYLLTQDLDRPRTRGRPRGEIKYWRGRRIDDDEPPQRLH